MSFRKIQKVLYQPQTTLKTIIDEYQDWVNYDQYLIFEHQRFHSPVRYIASLVPKRGNKKYAYKMQKRFKELSLPFDYEKKHTKEVPETQTNVLFLTLTYAVTDQSDFKKAWNELSYNWNKFLSNIRKHFGRVLTARCYESSEKGFPHIHCMLYFPDQTFPTFLKWSHKKQRYLWRIPFTTVEEIKQYWHSYIDIQGMVNLSDGFKYLGKYLSKSSDLSQKATKTLALTWAFHKRAFSIGNKFKEEIFKKYLSLDLTHLSLSQTYSSQMTLDNRELKGTLPSFLRFGNEKAEMIGIMGKNNLKRLGVIPICEWNFGLTDTQREYSLYCIMGKQEPILQPQTPQEFIKNVWKYLDGHMPNYQRAATLRGLRLQQVRNKVKRDTVRRVTRHVQTRLTV